MTDLAQTLKANPKMRVLLAGGYYDLATPYFEGVYEMRHLSIPASLQSNISYHYYEAGHMIYVNEQAQRAVTADELRAGVRVNLLELRAREVAGSGTTPMVVAWIEAGQPDLEFDGRRARPQPGSVYGVAKRDGQQGAVRVRLDRVAA